MYNSTYIFPFKRKHLNSKRTPKLDQTQRNNAFARCLYIDIEFNALMAKRALSKHCVVLPHCQYCQYCQCWPRPLVRCYTLVPIVQALLFKIICISIYPWFLIWFRFLFLLGYRYMTKQVLLLHFRDIY